MKRIYIFIAAALLAAGVQAQDNQLGLNLGAGMNTILYNPANGSRSAGLGFGAGLQYAHFFGQHFGFGIGVQYAVHNATAKYDGSVTSDETTVHPDNGLPYYPVNYYDKWRERQTMGVLSIPVELLWRTALNDDWKLMIGLGAQYDINTGASYSAVDGTFETRGLFPSTGVTYRNLPAYGFDTYQANQKGDIDVSKNGVSLIADAGVNHAIGNNWNLYLGIYAGYGLTNLYDTADANNDLLRVSSTNSSDIEYNGTLASDRIDAYNLFSLGVKVGINIGWICHHAGDKGDKGTLVPYSTPSDKAEAERLAAEAKAKAEAKAAAEKAAVEKAAAEAAEAARQARYANDAALNQAFNGIDADIAAAEELANQTGSVAAKSKVAQAKAKAQQAKAAQRNGKYADANDLMKEAYALLAGSYADDADAYAQQTGSADAARAREAAATYAEAARNGDLETAMAAMRNARINAPKSENLKNDSGKADNQNTKPADNNNVKPVDNQSKKPTMTQADKDNLMRYFGQINTGVHFGFNESTPIMENGSEIALRAVATAMSANNAIKVKCIGHTDSIGGEAYNKGLGMRRAQALKSKLVEYGAPSRNVATESCGKNEPVAPNDTEENRAKNRRAVIVLQ